WPGASRPSPTSPSSSASACPTPSRPGRSAPRPMAWWSGQPSCAGCWTEAAPRRRRRSWASCGPASMVDGAEDGAPAEGDRALLDDGKIEGCELCEAARITPWHHEDEVCWVADCEICDVPMVVWRRHGAQPPDPAVDHM